MTGGGQSVCAVCGRVLPSRYAVAGRCEVDGCDAAFCALHWHVGNRKCPAHGWSGCVAVHRDTENRIDLEKCKMTESVEGREMCARADRELSAEKTASMLKQIGGFALKLGAGAGALAKKLAGIKSTDEALTEIDARLAEARAHREPLGTRYEELYRTILSKKKLYQSAPPARRKLLELELKSAISEYQSIERQMAAYLKNETILTKVRGRMCELVAMNLRTVSEADIDKLTDKVERAADGAEDLDGAIEDLDKAGVRPERADKSFEDVLSAFDDAGVEPEKLASARAAGESADALADI